MNPRSTESFESRWRERFEDFARSHDDDAGIAGWSASGLAARFRRFAGLWRPGAERGMWLDVGCGAGTYTRLLVDKGMEVLGFDYSEPTLVKARTRVSGTTHWVAADVTRLPLQEASVDGVLCFGVVQALAESNAAVRELARVTRPGGQIWVDALNGWCAVNVWDRLRRRLGGRATHVRYEFPRQIVGLMRKAGVEDVRVCWVPVLPARLQVLQRLFETRALRALLHWVPPLGALLSHSFLVYGVKPVSRGEGI